jgi:hypothetical protein
MNWSFIETSMMIGQWPNSTGTHRTTQFLPLLERKSNDISLNTTTELLIILSFVYIVVKVVVKVSKYGTLTLSHRCAER